MHTYIHTYIHTHINIYWCTCMYCMCVLTYIAVHVHIPIYTKFLQLALIYTLSTNNHFHNTYAYIHTYIHTYPLIKVYIHYIHTGHCASLSFLNASENPLTDPPIDELSKGLESIKWYTYIHFDCIHTYSTYIYIYIGTVETGWRFWLPACRQRCTTTLSESRSRSYIHTYMHTYSYIQTYIHTNIGNNFEARIRPNHRADGIRRRKRWVRVISNTNYYYLSKKCYVYICMYVCM